MSWIHFWGWQLIIVSAAITLPLGITQGKEYAELEWPIDIAIALIWVVFAVNFIMTLKIRREKHMYVALWFYLASILAIAMLHIVNNLVLPFGFLGSYSVYSGVQDALVQWWYGHNAVGFFLTTPFLGLMYYFLPKAAEKPVFSYRLSIIHFWGLVFIYIWAGPHHLLYSAAPDWLQTLGMVFSVMLWAPSWGGMLNGLYTLRGAWHKVREEPVLKFFVLGVTAYGMSTFEGPLMSIKSVNKLSHFTDWTIAHVHVGALGWVAFMTYGMIYWLVPRLWKKELYSKTLANAHFWISSVGIALYALAMWTGGVTQGLMWFATKADGSLLYPDFMETVIAIQPAYMVRALGGLLFLSGSLIMLYNILKSISGAKDLADTKASAPALKRTVCTEEISALSSLSPAKSIFWSKLHEAIEGWPMVFGGVALVLLSIGGLVQIVPMLLAEKTTTPLARAVKPYTPLELKGRAIYVREGCYNCHSQNVRPILEETLRYGVVSRAHEYIYDKPFQWGSKRTGPDLHRIGGKYPDLWHYRHMQDPRTTTPRSIMPPYSWLIEKELDSSDVEARLKVLRKLGVPYSQDEISGASAALKIQAEEIAGRLKEQGGVENIASKEIVALIAYLQRLGKDQAPETNRAEK
jgi:cytochrome c oxidase cbb3-type subunit I/II